MSKEQFLRDNLNPGETYAGLILGQNGEKDYHLILLPGELDSANWKQAKTWAKKTGGSLPDRRELRLLWVNAKDQFKPEWYWSGAQYEGDSDYAWYQNFFNGLQNLNHINGSLRARAVRRVVI